MFFTTNLTKVAGIEAMMLSNSTNVTNDQFFDLSVTYHILRISSLYVQPFVGAIGLIGNCLTFIILSKEGLRKPPNIIMLSLTLADSLFLLRSVNAIQLLAKFGHPKIDSEFYGWEVSESTGYALYILDLLACAVENWGLFVSTGISVVITIERFTAVFFPLKFKYIMTTKTVLLIITAIWLFWFPWIFSTMFYYSVGFTTKLSGAMFTYMYVSQTLIDGSEIIDFLDSYLLNFLSSVVPAALVCFGCILIGVKIRLTQIARKRLSTTRKTKSLRTTRTLVSVSMIFAMIQITYFTISVVFHSDDRETTTFGLIIGEVLTTLTDVGASCNFFVYVILNPKFRKMLKKLFGCYKLKYESYEV